MDQRNIKILSELGKRHGNGVCADCGCRDVDYAIYNIGIFVCPRCAQIHNQMGSHVSKTKHLKLDHWEDSQVERLKQVGNLVAKARYEARVPVGFRRPQALMTTTTSPSTTIAMYSAPDPQILLEHWITSKYVREEFTTSHSSSCLPANNNDKGESSSSSSLPPLRPYLLGIMDSFLMKKGREDPRFFPRRFVLDATTLRYFVKEKSNPKAVIRLVDIDVTLTPPKLAKNCSLQLSYLKDGSTRHIYVYHDDPELVMQWYQALRIGKLGALKAACTATTGKSKHHNPASVYVPENVLLSFLPQDSLMEGWLWKAGPSPSYAHRRRWFTLSIHRKLMYHIDGLDAYAKGEIYLGTSDSGVDNQRVEQSITTASKIFDIDIKTSNITSSLAGYKVSIGGFGDDKMDPQRWVFSLHTPYRTFILAAETQSERDKWVALLDFVLKQELTPRDIATCSLLVRKRNGSTLGSISVSNPLSSLLSSSSSSTSASSSTPPGGGGSLSSYSNPGGSVR